MQRLNWKLKFGALFVVVGLLLAVGVLAQTATDSGSGSTTQTHDEQCISGGGKLCQNSDGTNWCSYSTSPCPAYDTASCSSQGGEWCAGTSGGTGWCATGGSTCPINDEATCTTKGRPWCKYSSGTGSSQTTYGGWCAEVGYKCPAYDEPSCTAQGSEWCTSSYGGSGWCSTTPGSCPINDKATCESKSRTWCVDSSSYSTSGGWCATTGGTCPNTTMTTMTPSTPSPTTFSWPQTETDCTKYKGVWCKNSGSWSSTLMSSGYCSSAGYTCPSDVPTGKISCWDSTYVDTYSACPTVPSSQSDCTTKGYKWCASTGSSYSSGWCTGNSYPCPVYPPAGKMTCPDSVSFAATITECPTNSSATPDPLVPQKTKVCSDGSTVLATATCPVYKVCPDGTKVLEQEVCPIKVNDAIATCFNKSGKWCLDKNGDTGYCILQGNCPTITEEEKKVEQPTALDAKQTKLVETMKKEYTRNLDTLEKTFKRLDDQESLAKIAALKEKLGSLPMDSSIFDTLEAIKDDIMTLREVKDDLIAQKGEIEMSARDLAMQKRALAQMKKNITMFSKQLDRIQAKMVRLEKQGFTIPSTLKELITQGKDLVKQIKEAKTPEEAFDAGYALADLSEDLNLWMPRLEQLARISTYFKRISTEINRRESEYKRVQVLVKRLKVDRESLDSYMAEVRTMLDSVKDAYGGLKTREWDEEEPFDFVQEQIIDQLTDVDDKFANIRALANLRASVNKIAAKIRTYNARIARLAKQKKDTSELKDLVDQLKEIHADLNALAKEKLANLDVNDVMEKFSSADALMEQIDDLLKIGAPSALEKALRGGLKIEKIETPELERQVIRAYRVASFFRRSPQQLAEYSSFTKSSTVNRWRNRLAIDQ